MSRLTEQVWFKNVKGNDAIGHLYVNGFEYFVKQDVSRQKVVNKLGQLEDVLEEFGIESAEELRSSLKCRSNFALWDKVKILEKENEQFKEQLSTATMWHGCDAIINKLKEENQQLKQSQNSKAIEVLTDILVNLCSKYSTIFDNNNESIRFLEVGQISDFINSQIEELKGVEYEKI